MKKWHIATGCAVVFGVILVIAVLSGLTANSPLAVAPAPSEMLQRHSNKDFDELQLSMSYDEASRALGHVGHFDFAGFGEKLPDDIPPGSKILFWPNPDGSRIVLIFANDRLIHKMQFGLR